MPFESWKNTSRKTADVQPFSRKHACDLARQKMNCSRKSTHFPQEQRPPIVAEEPQKNPYLSTGRKLVIHLFCQEQFLRIIHKQAASILFCITEEIIKVYLVCIWSFVCLNLVFICQPLWEIMRKTFQLILVHLTITIENFVQSILVGIRVIVLLSGANDTDLPATRVYMLSCCSPGKNGACPPS